MKIQNGNHFTCSQCGRENVVSLKTETINGHITQITDCYNCESRFEIYQSEINLLPQSLFQKDEVVTEKKKSNETFVTIIVVGLFLFAVVCYALDYFSATKSTNVEVSNSAIQRIENKSSPIALENPAPETSSNLQSPIVNEIYKGKFTLDENDIYQADNFTIELKENQIFYTKNDATKYFDAVYQGVYTNEPEPNIRFNYYKYYLSKKNTYLLISVNKEINHNGVFYYRLIIDGQTQLAL